jgi:hypothetical protein
MESRHEAAILRTLRDIECGHITLRCSVRYFDVRTGERLPSPVLERTASDRAPAVGFPQSGREPWECWWDLLAERGWIRLPTEREPACWQVTDEGRRVLAEWGER